MVGTFNGVEWGKQVYSTNLLRNKTIRVCSAKKATWARKLYIGKGVKDL